MKNENMSNDIRLLNLVKKHLGKDVELINYVTIQSDGLKLYFDLNVENMKRINRLNKFISFIEDNGFVRFKRGRIEITLW